jgi:hypothetical protein
MPMRNLRRLPENLQPPVDASLPPPRRWWLNGYRWCDTADDTPGPLVVCPVTRFLQFIEEGRPPLRRVLESATAQEGLPL